MFFAQKGDGPRILAVASPRLLASLLRSSPVIAPALLLTSWLPGALAGAVVGALLAFGIWSWQKRSTADAVADQAAQDAGLTVASDADDELPAGLEEVAVLAAGRSYRINSVATGEHQGRAVTTFGLRFNTGFRHRATLWRYIVVHLPDAGTADLRAVSLPDRAPEGILETFGHQSLEAPRTARGSDAGAGATWASRPALLEAAGDDALIETGPAGLTVLIPGEVEDSATLAAALDRAVRAAG